MHIFSPGDMFDFSLYCYGRNADFRLLFYLVRCTFQTQHGDGSIKKECIFTV